MRIRSFLLRSALSFALLAGLVPAPALASAAPAVPHPRVATTGGYHAAAAPDHVLVAFKDTSAEGIGATAGRNGLALASVRVKKRGPAVVMVPKGRGRDELIGQLRRDANVVYAEPDYVRHVLAYTAPNDPAYNDATTYDWDETTEA